jgi:hypothetical protein
VPDELKDIQQISTGSNLRVKDNDYAGSITTTGMAKQHWRCPKREPIYNM